MCQLEKSKNCFKEYSPTGPCDGRRGPRGQHRAEEIIQQRTEAEADPMVEETESLAAAEARLPHYLVNDSEDLEDDEDFIPSNPVPPAAHDDYEAGSSGAGIAVSAPPPITAAQVTAPDTL